jgi:TetR/AcrR family fatty acid metabolism transcriptional regulator
MNEHSFKELIRVAQETKARIRKAAIEVIAEEGFFNTRMQDVADRAQLAVGTIYNYFSSKDEVLSYIFKYEIQRRMKSISELKEQKLSTRRFLKKFLDRHFLTLRENPNLGRVLVREKEFSRAKDNNEIKENMNSLIKMLEDIFVEGINKAEIMDINAHLMAVYFFGSMQGIIEFALTEPEIEMLVDGPDFIIKRIEHIFK